jgi:hypothetical protein
MSTLDQKAFMVSLDLLVREEAGRYGNDGAHLTPEELAAYHSDELSEEKDVEVQLHLATCSECPDLLIDLEDLFEPRHRDLDLSDTWISGAWRDLRAKLGNAQDSERPFWRRWMYWFSAVPRPAYALATGLMFFLLVGGTVQISALRQELARPVGNIPDVPVPQGETTRGPETPKEVRFAPEVSKLRLDLRLAPPRQDFKSITAEFLEDGKLLWSVPVSRDSEGEVHIEISRRSLDPGIYEIHLKDVEKGDLGKYPIEVIHL